jgi:hypothetical protein
MLRLLLMRPGRRGRPVLAGLPDRLFGFLNARRHGRTGLHAFLDAGGARMLLDRLFGMACASGEQRRCRKTDKSKSETEWHVLPPRVSSTE